MSDLAKQFEELWESNDSAPDVFEFVEQHSDANAVDLLPVLLVDQSRRWKTDKPFKVEDYLQHLPSLANYPGNQAAIGNGRVPSKAEWEHRTKH